MPKSASGELYVAVPDTFEQERPMQPKRVVGDYVESQGILVPRRFETLEEAQFAAYSGVPVMARSEHPDEYSGPSGLGYSGYFEAAEDGVVKPLHYASKEALTCMFRRYVETAGSQEPDDYTAQASESYWQVIQGVNVTCIADDAVEGRYHVFGHKYVDGDGGMPTMIAGAIVEENGNVLRMIRTGASCKFTTRLKDIIDFYNTVRYLDRFSSSHCPIIEMQMGDEYDQLYFLQYHRARDATLVSERLKESDYDEREGWHRAEVVRGSYLGGKVLQLAMWYRGVLKDQVDARDIRLPEDGSTIIDYGFDYSFGLLDECIGRQRIAHLIASCFDREYDQIAANHGPRSRMFKPQLSMLTNPPHGRDYIPDELRREAIGLGIRGSKEVRIKTYVVSDGRIGFFRYSDELVIK